MSNCSPSLLLRPNSISMYNVQFLPKGRSVDEQVMGWSMAWPRVERPYWSAVGHAPRQIRSSRSMDEINGESASSLLFCSSQHRQGPSSCLPLRPSRTTPYPTRNMTFPHPYLHFVEPRNWKRCTRLLGTRTRHGVILSSIQTVSSVCSLKRASIICLLCPRLSNHQLYARLDVPEVFNYPY